VVHYPKVGCSGSDWVMNCREEMNAEYIIKYKTNRVRNINEKRRK